MAEAKLYGQNKGGTSINGIIKDYYAYAGENISAGDLVEYINGVAGKVDYGESVDTQLSDVEKSGRTISAVALGENRVFVAYSYSADLYLYGVVVTIDGATITYGSDKKLSTTNYTGFAISAIRLKENKVFIAHSHTNGYQLYGMLCTITDSTIKVETDIELASNNYQGYYISALALDENRVFIAHDYHSNDYLYGIVVTIDGTTITKGTDTSIHSSPYTSTRRSMCLLPNGNVFIAHSSGSSYQLYGTLVSISNTTITKKTVTELSTESNSGNNISVCLLPNGNVFIAHGYGSSYYLYGVVCSVSGTTITKGSDTLLANSANAGKVISCELLPNGKVFIARSGGTYSYLLSTVVNIDNTTITIDSDTALTDTSNTNNRYTGYAISSLLLANGTIFVAHSKTDSYYLNAQVFGIDYENNIPTNQISITEYETQVRQVTTGQFDGVAKTSGTGGDDTGHNDKVGIYTLVPTQEMTMADGNILADANGDIFLVREEIA